MSTETINGIRLEGEKLLRSLNSELYLNLVGLKKACNLAKIYRSHPAFSEPDLYMSLKDLTTNDEDEERSLRLLKSFAAVNFIESRTGDLLINLWRRGGRVDSSEIANSFGKGDLDTAPLLKTFEEAFRI
ncbi:MAG: hypothetical protein ACRENZ_06430 [Thermodesulfobacteriota bacterium]